MDVPHYMTKGAECIDIMRDFLTPEEFEGAMKFCILKYLYRAGDKRDKQKDLEKAADYANMLAYDCWTTDICHANKAEMMEADSVAAPKVPFCFGSTEITD